MSPIHFRKSNFQSFFVGTSRSSGDKVSIKEHHTGAYSESDVTEEILILSKLSHECIPKLAEVFITNISVFMVITFNVAFQHHPLIEL